MENTTKQNMIFSWDGYMMGIEQAESETVITLTMPKASRSGPMPYMGAVGTLSIKDSEPINAILNGARVDDDNNLMLEFIVQEDE